jgi:hypothetical protein
MTSFDEKFKKNFREDLPDKLKGDVFRKKMKETLKKPKEAPVRKKTGKPKPTNIMQMEKSLENLMKDERFPKKEKPPREMEKRQPPNKPSRVPGERKEMQPLSKGGRAGFKAGSKGCKLAMKGKGRAYGKNS